MYYAICVVSQLNIGNDLAVTCFDRYKDIDKKSQILITTESGFGGG